MINPFNTTAPEEAVEKIFHQGMQLKLSFRICDKDYLPGPALRLLLLGMSFENRKEKKWIFQRGKLKELLGMKNDGTLTQAFKCLEQRGIIKQSSTPHKSTKRRVTYTYRIDYLPGARFFFLPQDLVSPVGANGHKKRGPALELSAHSLRFLLFLHDEFSVQQSADETLKLGKHGRGLVIFNSVRAKARLGFRNLHRHVAELEQHGLLERGACNDDGKPIYYLTNPYFKKRKQPLPTDPPQIVVDEARLKLLIRRAEAHGLVAAKDWFPFEDLTCQYGFDWVEDALFTIKVMSSKGKPPGNVVEKVKAILTRWEENGKVIGFRDSDVNNPGNHKTEDLANLLMGCRPQMLQHLEFKDSIWFFDRDYAGSRQDGFPLLIPDFPCGLAYYEARDGLKQRFLVSANYDQQFNSWCETFGLGWVSDAFVTLEGPWKGATYQETERIKKVGELLQLWRSNQKWCFYAVDLGMRAWSTSPTRVENGKTISLRDFFANQWGTKVYAIFDPFVRRTSR